MKISRPLKKMLVLERAFHDLKRALDLHKFKDAGNIFKRIKRIKLM